MAGMYSDETDLKKITLFSFVFYSLLPFESSQSTPQQFNIFGQRLNPMFQFVVFSVKTFAF